jgi:hypothetical protein
MTAARIAEDEPMGALSHCVTLSRANAPLAPAGSSAYIDGMIEGAPDPCNA